MKASQIDIVIPWVDGADPQWRTERAQFTAGSACDNDEARFRDWNLLRYWFRAIEKNAPWAGKIHFVTWGHLPQWLNTTNHRLHIVNHRDFIPEEYLPTFSSHTIELNMHRIPGLSDEFLYFNDDVYLMEPSRESDFFRDGMPVDSAVCGVIKNGGKENFMPYIMLNMMGIINSDFSKREVLRKNWKKWFRPIYGKGLLMNLYLAPWPIFTGFRNYHTCIPYRKDTLQDVWDTEFEALDHTCRNRFRSREDVNQYIFRYWRLAKGDFVPGKPNSAYLTIGSESMDEISRTVNSHKYQVVCINDDPMGFDFDTEKAKLIDLLSKLFPEPSSFEK